MDNENWNEEDGADDWKFRPEPVEKNKMDFGSKIVVNSYAEVPFALNSWKIRKEEPQRVDIFHKNTYFSFVMGEKPFVEIFGADEYGQLDQLINVIELGDYLK